MSRVWRLHTKPKVSVKNKLEDKVADEIMKRKIVAIGWTLREDIYNELTNEDKIKLEERLYNVVEDSVNKVGVDLNTATFSLISYVAGISKKQAKAIVKHREDNRKIFRKKRTFKSIRSRRKSIYTSSRIFKNI